MKLSSGTLLYRLGPEGLEVLIVRPSGPAARFGWSLPKGLPDEGESLEAAAVRETLEETGVVVTGALRPLGFVEYKKSKKRVHGYAAPAAADVVPRVATWEVDAARFVKADEAARVLHEDQRVFVARLEELLAQDGS